MLRILGATRWDILVKAGGPRSMPCFFNSLKVTSTLAFVGTTVSEMTAANGGVGYLLIPAGSSVQMALGVDELSSHFEKNTTACAHSASQGKCARK